MMKNRKMKTRKRRILCEAEVNAEDGEGKNGRRIQISNDILKP